MDTTPRSTDRGNQLPGEAHRPADVDAAVYECEYPGCSRVFTKKTGRGVHYNAAHKDWYEEKKIRENQGGSKARWSDEEKRLLARREAQLQFDGERTGQLVRFMNMALEREIPNRTRDSIQSIRRKQEHKDLVSQYLTEIRQQHQAEGIPEPHSPPTQQLREDDDNILRRYVSNLGPINIGEHREDYLNAICADILDIDVVELRDRISLYIRSILPLKPRGIRGLGPEISLETLPRKRKRRRLYAKSQQLWQKDRGACWKAIDSDQLSAGPPDVPRNIMEPYWRAVVTRDSGATPGLRPNAEVRNDLWSPVTKEEIQKSFPRKRSASGPDGVTVVAVKAIPLPILHRILNIFMICGGLPDFLLVSRTVFIPKKKDSMEPGDFRPITISPVLIRLFHKVLANRLKTVSVDERQRAFRDTDGCSDNIFLLDLALRYTRRRISPLFMASTDVAKAFDSVSFQALREVMLAKGLPLAMVNYIMSTYNSSYTCLEFGGWRSDPIHPTCGVKQGDPMSPLLFNFLIDMMLQRMPDDVGIKISEMLINIMAFADDLILMATTREGLQHLLTFVCDFLESVGLRVNAQKCFTIAIKAMGKQKKTAIDANCRFTVGNQAIQALKRTDELRYLGVPFTSEGRITTNIRVLLREKLGKLGSAPLKPQQRLWILRSTIIPALLYHLTSGSIKIGLLRSVDRDIRASVRKWLSLPHDCPNAYFHADKKSGGLSIPSLRYIAPLQRQVKLETLMRSTYIIGNAADDFLERESSVCMNRLRSGDVILRNADDIKKYWASKLSESYDGRALKESSKVDG